MADLNTGSLPRPSGFEVLKKWCGWTTSPTLDENGDVDGFVVNATVFTMLVDFKRDGASLCQKPVNVDRSVVDGDQDQWNTMMANAEALTTDQLAAKPKVMAIINKAALGI